MPSSTASNRTRRTVAASAVLAAVLAWTAAACHAGGGPENVFLVVNAASADSIAVANAYAALRGVPPINVLFLDWKGSRQSVDIAEFRRSILAPIKSSIDARRLAPQIDMVV